MGRRRRRKPLLGDLKDTRGSTRSHSVDNLPRKRLWTCRRTKVWWPTQLILWSVVFKCKGSHFHRSVHITEFFCGGERGGETKVHLLTVFQLKLI